MAEQGSARKGGEAGASLEDLQADDEFEEFAVDGKNQRVNCMALSAWRWMMWSDVRCSKYT